MPYAGLCGCGGGGGVPDAAWLISAPHVFRVSSIEVMLIGFVVHFYCAVLCRAWQVSKKDNVRLSAQMV